MKYFLHSLIQLPSRHKNCQKGAISLAETLIVLSVGVAVLVVWAQNRMSQMEVDNARHAGTVIAAYARATATWLAEAPPASSGVYTIANLQDCNNPNGLRFLSCSFGVNTSIPYVLTDTGDAQTLGDVDIDVTIGPNGTLGIIDFGVFRGGDDVNDDGLPDSRPDLAAAAFQTAAEQTGAGVLDFFELAFAEPDPANVIIEPNHPNFDINRVDDLARLQARVGTLAAGNAPFLRIDGGNEMTGGLNFDNGMQVNMSQTGLVIAGPGDVEVSTTTGNLVVAEQIEANSMQAASADFDRLSVEPADGVSGGGFDRFNQAPDVVRIDADINRISSQVTVNETNIQSNRQSIAANQQEITRNLTDLVSLTGRVDTNTTAIQENRRRIDQNAEDISNIENNQFETCTPSRAAVIAANPGLLSCGGSSCIYCGTWRSVSSTYSYKTRNTATLACDTNSIRIYSSCCLESNGNCDGYCEFGVNKC